MKRIFAAGIAAVICADAASAQDLGTAGEFLVFCKNDVAACEEEIDVVDFVLVMDDRTVNYCAPPEGPDLATTRVRLIELLDAHPEVHDRPYDPFVYDLVQSLFPCE